MSIRATAKNVLVTSGLLRFAHRFSGQAAVILRYHSIQDCPEQHDLTIGCDSIHATAIFANHIELIAQRFSPASMDDVALFLKGEKALPPRAVVVTFDDGYKDNFRLAAPILNHFGVPGTFYLLVDSVDHAKAPWYCLLRHAFATARNPQWTNPATGKMHQLTDSKQRYDRFCEGAEICAQLSSEKRAEWIAEVMSSLDPVPFPDEGDLMMSWDDARKLLKDGHIVGSHTMTHPNVAHISLPDARLELSQSKALLERELAIPVQHFCYPHPALMPQWNEDTLRITAESGYTTAVTTGAGAVRSDTRPLAIPRTYIPRNEKDFLFHLERNLLWRKTHHAN